MILKTYSVSIMCLFCILIHAQVEPIDKLNETANVAVEQTRSICQKTFTKNNYPGLAVAVALGNKTLFAEGWGYADIENRKPIDPEKSMFRIGSISKTLTTAALQMAVQEGKIDLESDVRKYVKYFPKKKFPVIIDQVAGHIAGVRHYNGPMEMLSNVYYPTVRGGMEIFMDDPLLFEPGEKYSYSSYGWNLISAVIEEAMGTPFLDIMKVKVFEEFKMNDTQAEVRSALPEGLVSFYMHDQSKKNILTPDVDNSYKWAGGGFIATATDILKFSYQMHHSEVIDQKMLTKFQSPLTLNNGKKTNYGLGWATNTDKKGRRWVGHSGGSVGGTSMYLYYPDHDLTVVTLVNLSSARMEQLAWKIAEQFITQLEGND